MGSRLLQCFAFFLLNIFLSSGSSVAEKPPLEAIHQNRKLEYQEKWIPSSPSLYTTQLDTAVPIVNPTPPGTTTPIVNPVISPPSPTITPPTTTPPTLTPPTLTPPTTTPPTITPPTPTTTPTTSSGGSWCVANPTASPTTLQVALDYACGYGGADCSGIQPGASCYNPNTVRDHASFAFNEYYHKNPAPTSCVFGGAAQLTSTDPSSGSCRFPSSTASTSISPPVNSTPTTTPTTPITTPGIMSPDIMTPDSSTYGSAQPTGLPSSATSVSCSLLLLFITVGFVGSLATEKYL
ncbi:hypothetical protein EZV62_027107 [Acer yangbiense]|uniref:X8 domain-containing protein n=1 Tax=Acer yangbiense TaxID=1000413 RepID=A0A5C7GT63_9ROSI|nr:hypothetical protein EZV62_027107 [Acer yangbiense]